MQYTSLTTQRFYIINKKFYLGTFFFTVPEKKGKIILAAINDWHFSSNTKYKHSYVLKNTCSFTRYRLDALLQKAHV